MYSHSKDIKIFSANSNKPLAESIFHQRNRPWLRCIRDPVHL